MPLGGVTNHIGVRRRAHHLLVTHSFQHRSTTYFQYCLLLSLFPSFPISLCLPFFSYFILFFFNKKKKNNNTPYIETFTSSKLLAAKCIFFWCHTSQDGHVLLFAHLEKANNRKPFVHELTMALITHLFYSVTTVLASAKHGGENLYMCQHNDSCVFYGSEGIWRAACLSEGLLFC